MKFKRKSDPFIKISLLRSNLKLMVEMGQISQETIDKIFNWLSLDHIEREWNKPPVADQMFRDFVAFMEDYQVHFYLNGGQSLTIYWNNWMDRLWIAEAPNMFDIQYAKTLKRQYKEKAVLDRNVSREKLNWSIDKFIKERRLIEERRFPGRLTSKDERLETYLSSLYTDLKNSKDNAERTSIMELAEWLEELIALRKSLKIKKAWEKAQDAKKAVPFITHEFSQWLAHKYPLKITYNQIRKGIKEFKEIQPDIWYLNFEEVVDSLENLGWETRY